MCGLSRALRAACLLACVVSGGFAHAAPREAGSIRLFVSGVAAADLVHAEAVRWRGAVPQTVAVEAARSASATWLDIAAECEPGVRFVVTTSTRIGVAAMPATCVESQRLVLDLYPRARLTARFVTDATVSELPASGTARTSCAGAAMDIPFAIAPSNTTELDAPANCGVVALAVAKLAPVLIPPESLSTGSPHRLGTVTLKHGGSLLARVRSPAGGEPLELTTIVLRANDVDALRGEFSDSKLQPLARRATDRHGWASFYALTPAEIVLALRRPNQSLPQFTERYLLDPAAGLVIDDLEVSPPASLAVRLEVPEALAGELAATNIELSPAEANRWPKSAPIVVPALTDGTPSMLEVPPGAWTIAAVVRPKEGFLSRSASTQLALAPGSYEEVVLRVRGGVFPGRVLRGTDGVQGVLNLTPSDGAAASRRVTARTKDDGRFSILLEGPGMYTVAFEQPERGSIKFERYAEFRDPSKEVEIRLPAGEIRGTVVYENGVPAANADVSARQRASAGAMEAYARSGADGSFTLDSVAEGTWLVTAAVKGVDGDQVEVPLLEDAVADGVMLIIRPTVEVGIHVVDARGLSVPNAFAMIELPSTDLAAGRPAALRRADADGVVRMQVPESAEGVVANVIISTDDRLSAARVRLESDAVATVRLPARTGELRLKRLKGKWSDVRLARLVAKDGSSIPVPTASGGKAHLSDDLIRLRKVATGVWRYIEAQSPLDALSIRALDFLAVRPAAEFEVRPDVVNEITIQQ